MKINKVPWAGWSVLSPIGSGGFGTVYEIRRKLFDYEERSAVKIITIPHDQGEVEDLRSEGYTDEGITEHFKSFLEDIVKEYSLMAKMKGQSNIVDCDDLVFLPIEEGIGWNIYIKMELLTPINRYLEPLREETEILRLAMDLCTALIRCKKNNIVHRDIKPQNIFVSEDGDYKLGDFGIAKTSERVTSGTKIGTYKYMAPEVYNNKPYGPSVDIYSLGMVLYWLLNEYREPFLPLPPETPKSRQMEEARNRRFMGEPIPDPCHGSEDLRRIVRKACAYRPEDRYTSPEEMLAELKQCTMGQPAAQIEEAPRPLPEIDGADLTNEISQWLEKIEEEIPFFEETVMTARIGDTGTEYPREEEPFFSPDGEEEVTSGIWDSETGSAEILLEEGTETPIVAEPQPREQEETPSKDEEVTTGVLRRMTDSTKESELAKAPASTHIPVDPATPKKDRKSTPAEKELKPVPTREKKKSPSPTAKKPRREGKKRKMPPWLIIGGVAVLIAVAVGLFLPGQIKGQKYNQAMSLMDSGDYVRGAEAFKNLGDYADAEDQARECDFQRAKELFSNGFYEEAEELFLSLGDYNNASYEAKACSLQRGGKLFDDGAYEEAREIFLSLGDYGDAEDRLKACDYGIATDLYKDGFYGEAREIFCALGDYENAKELAKESGYHQGKALYEEGAYEEARDVFFSIGYHVSDELVKRCNFAIAMELYEAGEYEKALTIFKALGNHLMAKEYADRCLGEIAHNYLKNNDLKNAAKTMLDLMSGDDITLKDGYLLTSGWYISDRSDGYDQIDGYWAELYPEVIIYFDTQGNVTDIYKYEPEEECYSWIEAEEYTYGQ